MIVEEPGGKPVIDLSVSQESVFVLIGLVYRHQKFLTRSAKVVTDEMMAGDYAKAVALFKQELGEFYDVKLPKKLSSENVLRNRKDEDKVKLITIKKEPVELDSPSLVL